MVLSDMMYSVGLSHKKATQFVRFTLKNCERLGVFCNSLHMSILNVMHQNHGRHEINLLKILQYRWFTTVGCGLDWYWQPKIHFSGRGGYSKGFGGGKFKVKCSVHDRLFSIYIIVASSSNLFFKKGMLH